MEYQPRKLSYYQAEIIRELNADGIGQKKLANMYGVSRAAIKAIVQNKTYQNGKSETPEPRAGLF